MQIHPLAQRLEFNCRLLDSLDFLWLEITSKCNLQCTHCYAESGSDMPLVDKMQFLDWCTVLEDAFSLGCKKVQFIGGEVTLYPYLLALIEKANSLGYEFIEIFTNATVLTNKLLQEFQKRNVYLAFSIYSADEAIHDQITQRSGSYRKTIRSIKQSIEYGINVRASIIEMEANAACTNDTVKMLENIGIQHIGIDRVRSFGRGKDLVFATSSCEELCGYCSRGTLCVAPDGQVYPCVMSKFCSLGDVWQGLNSILKSNKLIQFRRETELRSSKRPRNSEADTRGKLAFETLAD